MPILNSATTSQRLFCKSTLCHEMMWSSSSHICQTHLLWIHRAKANFAGSKINLQWVRYTCIPPKQTLQPVELCSFCTILIDGVHYKRTLNSSMMISWWSHDDLTAKKVDRQVFVFVISMWVPYKSFAHQKHYCIMQGSSHPQMHFWSLTSTTASHTYQPWYLYMQDILIHFAGFCLLLQDNTAWQCS